MLNKKLFSYCKKNQFILIIGALSFALFPIIKYWKENPFMSDVDQYYSYNIALFIKNDLTFGFPNSYWLHQGPLNILIQKMSLGLAILYTPLFLIGHGIALLFNFEPDGYSTPYAYSIAFGTIIYVLIGLHYLRKTLFNYFPKNVVNTTILSIYFGTNLLFYTVGWGLMSHSYLFFMMCIVIYCTHCWYNTHQIKHIISIAFFISLMSVSRPLEITFILFPLFFGVKSLNDFEERISEWVKYKQQFLLAALVFLIPVIPQILYWKIFTGSWVYFSYKDEGFFFNNPRIWDVLFSFRKGLFIYCPILIISFIGLFLSYKKKYFIAVLTYTLINIFLVSSWWCWWYGGSFGMRALVQSYAVMAFPMAFVINFLFSKPLLKKISTGVISFLILLSLTQTYQFSHNFIHWDAMTKKAYTFSLFNFKYDPDERAYFDSVLNHPNYEGAKKGKSEETFERNLTVLKESKDSVILNPKNQFTPVFSQHVHELKVSRDDFIHFKGFLKNIGNDTAKVALVIDIFDGETRVEYLSKEIKLAPKNELNISEEIDLKAITNPNNKISTYIYLPKGDLLEINNYSISSVIIE